MFGSRSEYDHGVNTFSPEGRLLQVEYAIEAIKLGSSAVGLKTKEGVVLAVERRLGSSLLEPKSIEKICEIDEHIGCAVSGLVTDARTLVDYARVEAQNHWFVYNEQIRVRTLTQTSSDLALSFGETEGDKDSKKQKTMARPFGVALLIGGVDDTGPCLYHTDPSGTMIQYEAKGIGAADEGIQSILHEQYKNDLTLEEAETLALSCLKQVMEEKINKTNIELAVIPTSTRKFTSRPVDYVEKILKKLPN
jgi:20S proteasome subunit alpha 5